MELRGILTAAIVLAASSCTVGPAGDKTDEGNEGKVTLLLRAEGVAVRSEAPDEDLVTDLNVFIFNSYGLMEDKRYIKSSDFVRNGAGDYCYETGMLRDCSYSVYACANTGFEIPCGTLEELLEYRYYLAYPDDYRIGVPMSGGRTGIEYSGQTEIAVPLRRAMAKVSLSIDRSALNSDVDLAVTSVTVGNCPKSVLLFDKNKVSGTDDTYTVGFRLSDEGVYGLNRNVSGQVSSEVSLYMFENMQGNPLGDITDYADKEFAENDPLREQCSYLEISADYSSPTYRSLSGEGLVYRFYIGESASDFNVERNCHYHISLRPEGTGLNGGGWRVDKSGLEYSGPTSITASPSTYIRGKVGDVVDVRVTTVPEDVPLDLGMEELEFDKERGIYDYVLDDDLRGVTLTFTGSGVGLLYFEAGDPINDAELVLVEVDPPSTDVAGDESV